MGSAALQGCGSDASSPPSGTGNTGGSLCAKDAKITGTVTQCPGTTPAPLPDVCVNPCTLPGCANAACITQAQISQVAPTVTPNLISLLGHCTDGSLCTPIDYIATTGSFLLKKCTSLLGLEGRCASKCIPLVYQQSGYLQRDTCGADELCAPCLDPRYPAGDPKEDTQACHVACDPGPTQTNPAKFDSCGAGGGLCVPKSLVPAEYQAILPVDTCTQADYVCAPTKKAQDINYLFPKCDPSNSIFDTTPDGPGGQKGACVPHYLVDDTPNVPAGIIVQDTCAAGELCAPCNNPISTPPNQPTGACPLQ